MKAEALRTVLTPQEAPTMHYNYIGRIVYCKKFIITMLLQQVNFNCSLILQMSISLWFKYFSSLAAFPSSPGNIFFSVYAIFISPHEENLLLQTQTDSNILATRLRRAFKLTLLILRIKKLTTFKYFLKILLML